MSLPLVMMPTETPTPPRGISPSKGLTPYWALSFYRRRKSVKSSAGIERTKNPTLLVPQSTSLSSESGDSRSFRSNTSRVRSSFRDMMNRLRSSSSVTLVNDASLQESDFKQIYDWFDGFDRYNQLVTTRISTRQAGPTEDFNKICSILSKNCGGRFVHGLPEAVFDLALLWCPAEPLQRKDTQEPTWSWTGWEGAVNFPLDPTNCPDVLNLPRNEGDWFKSEIVQFHVGPQSSPYTLRREKGERNLRILYPPYFHAPRGYDMSTDSNALRFTAQTISADGFSVEQLDFDGKPIPCSHLINSKNQHCGVIMDFEESISAPSSSGPFEFVLVSRNLRRTPATHTRRPASSTIHPPGTPIWHDGRFIWDQEVADYDEDLFDSGAWKMLNVILIKWVGDYAERVAVARIHEDAWLQCNPIKQEIVLR